jgi:CDP-diacylglycerol--glycerol-3-phosphate 3-phosphatidyltransferase
MPDNSTRKQNTTMLSMLPNILTIARIFLTGFFVYFIVQPGLTNKAAGAAIFLVASITDFLDGYLAKKYQLITDFGKIMDPIADKFLMLAAFYIFSYFNIVAFWMFVIIFIRETFITVWRLMAIRQGKVLAAERAGKLKTVLQVVVVYLILIYQLLAEADVFSVWPAAVVGGYIQVINGLMLIVVGVTLYSGIAYFVQNKR